MTLEYHHYLLCGQRAFPPVKISFPCHVQHHSQYCSRIQTGVSLLPSKQMAQLSCSSSYLLAQHYRVKSIESDISRLYLPASKQAGYHKKSYHWFYQLFLSKQVSWLKSLLLQKVSMVFVVFFHTWGLCPNRCFMDDSSGIWSRDWSLYWPVW